MSMLHAVAIGGKPNTGKTRILLTAPKPIGIIVCDRPGGDIDLRELEDIGIHLYQVDMRNWRDSALEKINKLRADIPKLGLQSAAIDSFSMGQGAQLEKNTNHSRNSMNLKKWGAVGNDVLDVMDAFYGLQGVHRIGTFHIKEEAIMSPDGKEKLGTMWKPAVTPMVANQMKVFCGLIGYTVKRPRADGKSNDYSVCFLERMKARVGEMVFDCAKSPEGWSHSEPAHIEEWFERIEREADEKRKVAREAALSKKAVVRPPEPEPEPADDAKQQNNTDLPE